MKSCQKGNLFNFIAYAHSCFYWKTDLGNLIVPPTKKIISTIEKTIPISKSSLSFQNIIDNATTYEITITNIFTGEVTNRCPL